MSSYPSLRRCSEGLLEGRVGRAGQRSLQMVGEDVGSVSWISGLLAVVTDKRWRSRGASSKPSADGWPEAVVSRSASKTPSFPLYFFPTVLLQLAPDVAAELVELATSGVVRPRRVTTLETSTLADEDEQPPRQRQAASVDPRLGSGQCGVRAGLEGALNLVRQPVDTARAGRRSGKRPWRRSWE